MGKTLPKSETGALREDKRTQLRLRNWGGDETFKLSHRGQAGRIAGTGGRGTGVGSCLRQEDLLKIQGQEESRKEWSGGERQEMRRERKWRNPDCVTTKMATPQSAGQSSGITET